MIDVVPALYNVIHRPESRAALLVLPALLVLAACTAPPGTPAPTATVTVTMPSQPPAPSNDADDEGNWQPSEPSFDPWQEAVWIFVKSEYSGKPVEQRYLAVIKDASYDEKSDSLAVSLDKVTWNSKYSDGNDEEPILNPVVKWETVDLGEVAVLVDAANGFQHLSRADFPALVKDDDTRAKSKDGAGWRTPFGVWFVGTEPVALIERYVP
jgi:hypothetical protein